MITTTTSSTAIARSPSLSSISSSTESVTSNQTVPAEATLLPTPNRKNHSSSPSLPPTPQVKPSSPSSSLSPPSPWDDTTARATRADWILLYAMKTILGLGDEIQAGKEKMISTSASSPPSQPATATAPSGATALSSSSSPLHLSPSFWGRVVLFLHEFDRAFTMSNTGSKPLFNRVDQEMCRQQWVRLRTEFRGCQLPLQRQQAQQGIATTMPVPTVEEQKKDATRLKTYLARRQSENANQQWTKENDPSSVWPQELLGMELWKVTERTRSSSPLATQRSTLVGGPKVTTLASSPVPLTVVSSPSTHPPTTIPSFAPIAVVNSSSGQAASATSSHPAVNKQEPTRSTKVHTPSPASTLSSLPLKVTDPLPFSTSIFASASIPDWLSSLPPMPSPPAAVSTPLRPPSLDPDSATKVPEPPPQPLHVAATNTTSITTTTLRSQQQQIQQSLNRIHTKPLGQQGREQDQRQYQQGDDTDQICQQQQHVGSATATVVSTEETANGRHQPPPSKRQRRKRKGKEKFSDDDVTETITFEDADEDGDDVAVLIKQDEEERQQQPWDKANTSSRQWQHQWRPSRTAKVAGQQRLREMIASWESKEAIVLEDERRQDQELEQQQEHTQDPHVLSEADEVIKTKVEVQMEVEMTENQQTVQKKHLQQNQEQDNDKEMHDFTSLAPMKRRRQSSKDHDGDSSLIDGRSSSLMHSTALNTKKNTISTADSTTTSNRAVSEPVMVGEAEGRARKDHQPLLPTVGPSLRDVMAMRGWVTQPISIVGSQNFHDFTTNTSPVSAAGFGLGKETNTRTSFIQSSASPGRSFGAGAGAGTKPMYVPSSNEGSPSLSVVDDDDPMGGDDEEEEMAFISASTTSPGGIRIDFAKVSPGGAMSPSGINSSHSSEPLQCRYHSPSISAAAFRRAPAASDAVVAANALSPPSTVPTPPLSQQPRTLFSSPTRPRPQPQSSPLASLSSPPSSSSASSLLPPPPLAPLSSIRRKRQQLTELLLRCLDDADTDMLSMLEAQQQTIQRQDERLQTLNAVVESQKAEIASLNSSVGILTDAVIVLQEEERAARRRGCVCSIHNNQQQT